MKIIETYISYFITGYQKYTFTASLLIKY